MEDCWVSERWSRPHYGGIPLDPDRRFRLAREALDGYVHGSSASIQATQVALKKMASVGVVILVEGVSDQVAIEALAVRRGRDLLAEGVAVLPIGGAQAIGRYLRQFGPAGEQLVLTGLCDADGFETFRRALAETGVGDPKTISEMASLGFGVCVADLEDELIRAVGPKRVERIVESQGDLRSFRTFQQQPNWRGCRTGDQLRRFFGSKSSRHIRYARLLARSVEVDRVPGPFEVVLDAIDR